MPAKTQPPGVCDHCFGPIPPNQWYTRRGPRLYCSVDCRNTANSRAGAAERGRKAKDRVQSGTWQNPAQLNPPDPANLSAGARRLRLREVAEGRWRNPGLTPEARAINSQPHKHTGLLASAIEKLDAGQTMTDLTPAEAEAYRAYRRQLRVAHRDAANAYQRHRYHARMVNRTRPR